MRSFKEIEEPWAGTQFITRYNAIRGTSFQFVERRTEPEPDLLFRDGVQELWVEISGVHIDQDSAQFEAMNALGRPDAPQGWGSLKPGGRVQAIDTGLRDFLQRRLDDKATKHYSKVPILVLYHYSRFWTEESDAERLIRRVTIPTVHPFSEMFFMAFLTVDPASPVLFLLG
jgi:hypothetical protein